MQPPPPPPPSSLPASDGSSQHGHRRGFEDVLSRRPVQQQLDPRLAGPSPLAPPAATSSSSPSSSSTSKPVPKVSCLECRSSKVKCLPQTAHDPPGHPCARCQRLSKSCVYEKHKRGRKPDSVKYGKLEKQLETLLSELREEKAKAANRKSGGTKGAQAAQQQHEEDEDEDAEDYYDEEEEGEEGPAAKRLRAETAEILTNWSANSSSTSPSLSSSSRQKRAAPGAPSSSSSAAAAAVLSSTGEDTLPEAGAPLLSNPLKLLAQASAGEDDEDVVGTGAVRRPSMAMDAGNAIYPSSPPLGPTNGAAPPTARRPRDRLGLYDAKPEVGPHLDPISVGHVSLESARHLWSFFLEKLSHPLILLDRSLYTFDYTRPRSAMLLSVGLALAARLVPSTPSLRTDEIAERLDQHVLHKIIPVVLLEGKRSIHCVKAFLLLAAYNGQSIPLTQDRSFSYVTSAFSMCVELDLNCKMVSTSADQDDEVLQRKLRERERTYFLAWTYFFSICLHHGRHCSLSIHDRVVAASNDWHTSRFALPEDAGLVSNVQLRKLISRNLDYYHQHVAPLMPKSAADGPPDEACRLLLDFHRKSINEDLDQWHAQWVLPQAAKAAGSSGDVDTAHAPLRLQSTAFYHSYATLILHALPLRCGSLNPGGPSAPPPAPAPASGRAASVDEVLAPFRRKADEAALSCVALFLRFSRDQLLYGHNSSHVTVGFAAVHALRAPYNSAAAAAGPGAAEGSQSAEDKGDEVLGMVKRVIEKMEEAGRVTEHRKAFSTGYAVFLKKLVAIHEMRRRQRRGGTVAAGALQGAASSTATGKAGQSSASATTTTRGRRKRGETTSGRPSSLSGSATTDGAVQHAAPSSSMATQQAPAAVGRSSSAHAIPMTTTAGPGTSLDYSHSGGNSGYPPPAGSSAMGGTAHFPSPSSSVLAAHDGSIISPSLAHHGGSSNNNATTTTTTSFFDVSGSGGSGTNSSGDSFPLQDAAATSAFTAPGTGSGSTASLLDELLMAQPLGLQFDSWLDDLAMGGAGAGGFFNGAGGGGGAGGYAAGGATVDDANGHGYYATGGNENGGA